MFLSFKDQMKDIFIIISNRKRIFCSASFVANEEPDSITVKPGLYLPRFFSCGKTRRFLAKHNDFPHLSAICRDDAQQ